MAARKRIKYSNDYAKVLADFDASYKEMIERIGKVPESKNSSKKETPKQDKQD
ncbi:MAG: hypothetical protein RL129_1440 [Actinomycetota bacterium]|jgi:hypothetical protein